ncbi:pseudaminic acid cytidylyltransferase [Gaetbulibacter sp. M240]|uniref:pseudaminic acid cytidylyltransferase n=1 Tax=Gaetbulibacter sp. M240 TaxID=3126511 RepID=UPI00374EAA40
MRRVAIIPARGGSKRIPRKNIKSFCGKPILAYSIEAALKSNLFNEVMVSTDDPEIADVAKNLGAKVPFLRSVKSSNDYATTFDVLEEVLSSYSKQNICFNQGCCIYPTAPFTTPAKLIKFFNYLDVSNFDCVFPVVKYSYPIQRALKLDESNKMSMVSPENIVARSQDLSNSYHDAGQFYCFKIDKLLEAKSLWTENTGAFEIKEMEVQDIDNIEDWEIAEFKYKLLLEKNAI